MLFASSRIWLGFGCSRPLAASLVSMSSSKAGRSVSLRGSRCERPDGEGSVGLGGGDEEGWGVSEKLFEPGGG